MGRFLARIGLSRADSEQPTPSGSGGLLALDHAASGRTEYDSFPVTREQSSISDGDSGVACTEEDAGRRDAVNCYSQDIRAAAPAMNGGSAGPGQSQDRSAILEPLHRHPRYELLSDLNRGASGFVQLALDRQTGKEVAIKFIRHGQGFESRIVARELINQRMCYAHPHIVQLQEVFKTQFYLGIAMEFCDGGDLSQFIDNRTQHCVFGLPECQARWLFQQLMVAVDYCHRLGIVNRDIKLDNIMLHGDWPRPILKICDFGYSKDEVGQSVSKSTCGTPEYMAPEVLFEEKYDGKGADVWSCGVSLYVMLAGMFPFARAADEDETNVMRMQRMFTRIIKADYEPLPHVSPSGQHLLHLMLCPNPRERITVAEVMRHPWFQQDLPPPLLTINGHLTQAVGISGGIGANVQSAAQILKLVADCSHDHSFRTTSAQMPTASDMSVSVSPAESGTDGFRRKPSPLGPLPPVQAAPRPRKARTLNYLTRSSL